ncbi:HNH endonuclease [Escherichia phage IME267]|uniref:HNH nuclease domain-containing protein n=1 Tax=Escherichia phage IME267 TaxID=2860374 RepID=A0AAE8BFK7_9CAUD|nr:HNH endonuclease [Escherichia phage IME267]QYC96916.1 hypothetical protein [Escherichia phage IME267]
MIAKDVKSKIIHDFFEANFETGQVYWKVRRGTKIRAGDEAGCIDSLGRWKLCCQGFTFRRYQVIWCLKHGTFPETQIDHINRNPLDDRLSNLRLVTNEVNSWNKGLNSNNRSGVKGVYLSKGRYIANIFIQGKTLYLGTFDTLEEAAKCRQEKEQEHVSSI